MYNLYTDGGCINNGKINAKAKYAFLIYNIEKEKVEYTEKGNVIRKIIKLNGKEVIYMPSSSRAELLAIVKGLEYFLSKNIKDTINLYTDSQYCFNTITKWVIDWEENNELHKKAHVDLLLRLLKCMESLNIVANHINSHISKPKEPAKQLHWNFNNVVDELCNFN